MKNKHNRYFLFSLFQAALLAIFPFFGFSQQKNESVPAALESYSAKNIQEKIFVHLSKNLFVPGEIIWFKVYITDARLHVPIDLSKVAYIEVLDSKNIPALQAKIKLKQGTGNGSFQLPASLSSGSYRLRAYTAWMKNNDAGYFFQTQITIINTLKRLPATTLETFQYKVQLFPEGGNLLMGVSNTVAFKITNQYGKGADGNGVLLGQNIDTITRLKSRYGGMGRFEFIPKPGINYKVVLNIDGKTIEALLPEIYPTGFNLHLTETQNSQLQLIVSSYGKESNSSILFLSHTRGKLNIAETKNITNERAVFTIDKSSLPTGITTFTIFNSVNQPIAERLYFKRPGSFPLKINADKTEYALRSKVVLGCDISDQSFSPGEIANLSLSVFLLDSLQYKNPNDILSYFWLSSDVKGEIENPSYYFEQNTDEAADDLMLTQGWRRFDWKDVLQNNKPVVYFPPEHEGHIITGRVANRTNGLGTPDINAYLSSPARIYQFSAARSGKLGIVYFNSGEISGTENFVVQTDPHFYKDYRLDIISPFSESYPYSPLPGLKVFPSLRAELLNNSINSQIQFIYNNDSLNKFLPPGDIIPFWGKADKSYLLDDYTRFTTMEEVLREYVKEVAPVKSGHKFHLNVLKEAQDFYDGDPLVLVDGVPFFDMDSVMTIDPLKIQKIDILKREYILGPLKTKGLISFSTYKGDLDGIRLDPHAVIVDYEGLQLQRQFYAPVYETDAQKKDHLPDFRNQLYWNPDIVVSNSDQPTLSFFTSDLEGKYLIEVKGITSEGKILSGSYFFSVKK